MYGIAFVHFDVAVHLPRTNASTGTHLDTLTTQFTGDYAHTFKGVRLRALDVETGGAVRAEVRSAQAVASNIV